ncbi:uncharacterized protein LOC102699379 [Oryza brachyantha]|uniref:uncharacterized protein LOC102699379 n=1 Tax=Oryza brachyantha TaxID=4533 RepID=UPI000776203F|nr:uncharacterized protein LOC102699379 [Oryza brachyantha]
MEGDEYDNDSVLSAANITLVVVGKLGCGKSATGNSILRRKAFVSEYSHVRVTNTCHIEGAILEDGRTIDVIDTPGLFDTTISTEDAGKEIVKCMSMAEDGIHAMLVVFSASSRFSLEDYSTIERIKEYFGEKIVDHMILAFTHGDLVGETKLKSMLNHAPEYLQKIVDLCQNRVVLFDNMTKDRRLQQKQVEKLLDVVDSISANNGGKLFSDPVPAHNKLSDKEQDCPRQNSDAITSKSMPHVDHKKIPIREATNHYFGNIHNTISQSSVIVDSVSFDDSHYSELRPVYRDGESFYRSFAFSYLEQIVDRKDTYEENRLLAAIGELASPAELFHWTSDFSRRRDTFQAMIEKIKGWKVMRDFPKSTISHSGEEFLLEFFSSYDTTDDIFAFLRLAAGIWMCSDDHRGMYEARVTGLGEGRSLEDWCLTQVIPPRVDAEGVAVSALAATLQVDIRVEHPNGENTEDNCSTASGTPRVTLLCVDSHYDILYPIPPAAATTADPAAKTSNGGADKREGDPAKSSSETAASASWLNCLLPAGCKKKQA